MRQFAKYLSGIGALICGISAVLIWFVGHDHSTALLVAFFGVMVSGMSPPTAPSGTRSSRVTAHNHHESDLQSVRRRLLADLEEHQRNAERGEGPAASS